MKETLKLDTKNLIGYGRTIGDSKHVLLSVDRHTHSPKHLCTLARN